jgi:signal transduction histidine kinase/ActR/RegA family two-component response regulator
MNSGYRGLFPRYAATLMGLTSLVVFATGAIYLGVLHREVGEAASSVQRSEARVAAARIEDFLVVLRTSLGETASLPWNAGVLSLAHRREEYHRLMKILPAVAELRWIGNDGRERLKVSRFDMDSWNSGTPVLDAGAVAAARANRFLQGRTYFKDGSEPFLTLAVASPADRDGLLVADIDLKFVTEVVRKIQLGAEGTIYVAGADGRLIAHPNLNLVLRQTDLSQYAPLRALREALARGENEAAGMFEGRGLESGEVLVSGAAIPSAEWIVVAEQRKDVVLAPLYQAMLHVGVVMLAALAAALLVSYGLARRLVRPILELRRGAESIGAGDLNARIDVQGDDELRALAREFNKMAAQLEDYTTGLERKVKEKTADLQTALGIAEEAMRARALFLAAASHDLRQPLYAISILADTLALGDLDPGAANVLDKQRQAIGVLRGLFENLLDLSRFDAGEIRPAVRVVTLRETLAPCILEHEVVCHAKGLRFESEVEQAWVRTDPDLVRRVVGNLLSNAVRYTHAGRVSLSARLEGAEALVTVADTGIGIAAADQQRVFDEFVQISNPSREREKGVGLGLSIVRRIANLLDLKLALESAPSAGTTVTFRIPVATGVHGATTQADLFHAAAGAFKGARVWIVEDDPLVRDALALQFNTWEALPAFAGNLAEVMSLREADGRWPDAAIVDDMLRAGDRGLDIALALRDAMGAERVVLVTGNVGPERIASLESTGLTVLRKPLASSDLAQWLRQVLDHPALKASPAPVPAR